MFTKYAETSFVPKEWNASGAMQCYSSRELRSFVVEVFLSEDVKGDLLQTAVNRTLERMPYYGWTLVRMKGLYYYAENDLPFVIAESEGPRMMGGKSTNYHMVDVTYSGEKIDFAMFHGFTDGLGLNRFIEATLYHYFCLKDGCEYNDEGIVTSKIPYDPQEVADGFEVKTDADKEELKKLANSEKRFRVPELDAADGKGPKMYRKPLRIKTEDLLSWCKENSTSPAAAVSVFMAKAVANEHAVEEGVIMSVLPFSLRKYLHVDKTFKNTDSAIFLPLAPADLRQKPAGEVAAQIRQTMKAQMNEDMAKILSSSINLVTHLGKKMPFFWLKTKVFALPEKRPQDTFFVDYVGGLRTNDYADQVTEVRYLNADPSNGSFFVLMSETAGYFHTNITHTFPSDRYYLAFCAVLDELGIPYEKLPCDTYLNPVVELPLEQRRK